MIPTIDDPSVYLGDVYILQDDGVIGMVGGIKFRRYPRLLLSRFFSPPDADGSKHDAPPAPVAKLVDGNSHVATKTPTVPTATLPPTPTITPPSIPAPATATATVNTAADPSANASLDSNSTAAKAIALVATEAALELEDVHDDATFASLGVDSLMSLVIAEKFREELGVTVSGSLFLEYPTVGDLRSWLLEYYD
jgi:monodictyphenone polyketide synthase